MSWNVILILLVIFFLLANALGVILVMFQLPGTWWMVFVTGCTSVIQSRMDVHVWVGRCGLAILLFLALLGEVIELMLSLAGAAGAKRSKQGAILGFIGGIAGAVIGSFALPFLPVIAPLGGAALGTVSGSILGDHWTKRPLDKALQASLADATGRLPGTITKIAVACTMWLVILVALAYRW